MPGQAKRKRRREAERLRHAARTAPGLGHWEVILETQDQAELRAYLRRLQEVGIDPGIVRVDMFCGRMQQPTAYRMSRFVADPASGTDDLDRLAHGWWEAYRLATGTREQRKSWSMGEPAEVHADWEQVTALVEHGGEAALEVVLALLRSAPDADGVAAVGAGPLEDLVVAHGQNLWARMEELGRQVPTFRQAMAAVGR